MDPTTVEMTARMAEGISQISDLISALSYLAAIGMGLKGALSIKEHSENPQSVPISKAITLLGVSGALIALPAMMQGMAPNMEIKPTQVAEEAKIVKIQAASIGGANAPLQKESPGSMAASESKPATDEASAGKRDVAAPQAKIPEEKPVAAKAINVEKLSTPEEARAQADRKAVFEVLLGMAIAFAIGALAWLAAKRRRGAAPSQALPEVQFLGGAGQSEFASSDIFAKTVAVEKAVVKAP